MASRWGARCADFRVDELGDGQLFIEAGSPPYVLVRTADDYVVVNFADSRRTDELYSQLREATNARADR